MWAWLSVHVLKPFAHFLAYAIALYARGKIRQWQATREDKAKNRETLQQTLDAGTESEREAAARRMRDSF